MSVKSDHFSQLDTTKCKGAKFSAVLLRSTQEAIHLYLLVKCDLSLDFDNKFLMKEVFYTTRYTEKRYLNLHGGTHEIFTCFTL